MTIAVLIVEDEFLLRLDAVDFMGGCGFTMYEAGNADEAIQLLELHDDIRVVFTDINMPGSMDGLKLAHYVRGRWPPIKLEAIQLLELHDDIRVVFTDIIMPGSMDGLEVSPLRSGTLATDQTHHHLWPAETACRRHAGWKRIHR